MISKLFVFLILIGSTTSGYAAYVGGDSSSSTASSSLTSTHVYDALRQAAEVLEPGTGANPTLTSSLSAGLLDELSEKLTPFVELVRIRIEIPGVPPLPARTEDAVPPLRIILRNVPLGHLDLFLDGATHVASICEALPVPNISAVSTYISYVFVGDQALGDVHNLFKRLESGDQFSKVNNALRESVSPEDMQRFMDEVGPSLEGVTGSDECVDIIVRSARDFT